MEVGRVRSEAQGVPTSVEFRAIFWHLIWRSFLSIFGSSVIPVLRIWVGRKADQELEGRVDALLATTGLIAAMADGIRHGKERPMRRSGAGERRC